MELAAGSQGQQRGLRRGSIARNQSAKPGGSGATLTFPVDMPRFFIKLLSPKGGLVIDPFSGSGTTAIAAIQESRRCILIDNNAEYCEQARLRIQKECGSQIPIVSTTYQAKGASSYKHAA